ncbi:NYN domain-containing protein [uncultured Pigmentiphaga sp.]|mgnify:FL=1|uniref:NYN domain-containing protein n=1 Tax=uncultured Pigmentiphaga sp. TaxID=340361 RepID=UPI0026108747|nr:NYN domain-containing protein [uncultured Pigmentiphaga sp.]
MTDARLRTSVYVDAFNLYYGTMKGRGPGYKWLDLELLCRRYLPRNDITAIKYFTALVSARPNDPQQPARQQAYLRALATLPTVQVTYGHYLSHAVMARLANPQRGANPWVRVLRTEEKGSDVNLASHLLHDAHLDRYDVAVVISNDSDLVEPIKLVRAELGKRVGILNPQKYPSVHLRDHCDFLKQIRPGVVQASQLPEIVTDNNGAHIQKPATW